MNFDRAAREEITQSTPVATPLLEPGYVPVPENLKTVIASITRIDNRANCHETIVFLDDKSGGRVFSAVNDERINCLNRIKRKANNNISISRDTLRLTLKGPVSDVEHARKHLISFIEKIASGKCGSKHDLKAALDSVLGKTAHLDNPYQIKSLPAEYSFTAPQTKVLSAAEKCGLIIFTGPPGTAKTYTTLLAAIKKINAGEADTIYYYRPVFLEPGEKGIIAAFGGNEDKKLGPYYENLVDVLTDILGEREAERIIKDGRIQRLPESRARGRSLQRAILILDEAQNTTGHTLRKFTTRASQGLDPSFKETIFILGDLGQKDTASHIENGLLVALATLTPNNLGPDINFCLVEANERHVVRGPNTRAIVRAWELGPDPNSRFKVSLGQNNLLAHPKPTG